MNSQRIGRIEELLLSQNEQLGELQKRLPELGEASVVLAEPEPAKKGFGHGCSANRDLLNE